MFDEMWFLTTCPMSTVPDRRFFQGKTAGVFYCHEQIQFFDKHCRFFFYCISSLAGTTVVRFSKTLTVSNSAEFKSFLLNMCMLEMESSANLCASVLRMCSKLHSLVGEKKTALSVSLSFKIFLANLHASPRHRSCLLIFS